MIDLLRLIHRFEEPSEEELKECAKTFNLGILSREEPHIGNYETVEEYKTVKLNWLWFRKGRELFLKDKDIIKLNQSLELRSRVLAEKDKQITSLNNRLADFKTNIDIRSINQRLMGLNPKCFPVFMSILEMGPGSLNEMVERLKVYNISKTSMWRYIKDLQRAGLLDEGFRIKKLEKPNDLGIAYKAVQADSQNINSGKTS